MFCYTSFRNIRQHMTITPVYEKKTSTNLFYIIPVSLKRSCQQYEVKSFQILIPTFREYNTKSLHLMTS